jgi:hypothetical protein
VVESRTVEEQLLYEILIVKATIVKAAIVRHYCEATIVEPAPLGRHRRPISIPSDRHDGDVQLNAASECRYQLHHRRAVWSSLGDIVLRTSNRNQETASRY